MNYVKSFNLLGVEAQQIPCITGEGAPTTSTEGAVGCLYMDTTNGDIYKCTVVDGEKYTWENTKKPATDCYAYLSHNTDFNYTANTLIFNENLNIVCGTEKVFLFYVDDILSLATAAGLTVDNTLKSVTGTSVFVFYFDRITKKIGFITGKLVDDTEKIVLFSYSYGSCFGLLVDLYNSQRSRKVDDIEDIVHVDNQDENPMRHGYSYNACFAPVEGALNPDDGSEFVDANRMRSNFITILKPAYYEKTKDICVRVFKYSLDGDFVKADDWVGAFAKYRWLEGGYKYRFLFANSQWQMPDKNLIAKSVKLYCDGRNDLAHCSDFLLSEVWDTATKGEAEQELSFSFAMVSDVHHSNHGSITNWTDTVLSIGNVNSIYPIDAIFSLGDQIEGNTTNVEGKEILKRMRNDLLNISENSFMLTGNHDTNDYYDTTNHTERLSVADRYSILGRHTNTKVVKNGIANYGYYDIDSLKIRVVMLDNLETDTIYGSDVVTMGYSSEQVGWVRDVALDTEYQVIFFAHSGVTGAFNYRTIQQVNGVELRNVIESFIANGGVVIGMFHGHTHWDYIGKHSDTNGFYEISTASGNCTKITTPEIEGAVCPERTKGTVTQELWDLVIVKPISRTVKMIRFGAGDDRTFSY